MHNIKKHIRIIDNYPREGIKFQDITPLLNNKEIFKHTIALLADMVKQKEIDKVAALEARGFIFGSALALYLGLGFIPIRKKGKLPAKTIQTEYELEYGTDIIEIHEDAIKEHENILLVDDIIASGGTALAAVKLLQELKANIIGALFLSELCFLPGVEQLKQAGIEVYSLLKEP